MYKFTAKFSLKKTIYFCPGFGMIFCKIVGRKYVDWLLSMMKMTWSEWQMKENCYVLVKEFHENFHSKTLSYRKIKSVFSVVKWCFNASWGLKVLRVYVLNNVGYVKTRMCFTAISWILSFYICPCFVLIGSLILTLLTRITTMVIFTSFFSEWE